MQVSLAQHDQVFAAKLDLIALVLAEQHLVADLGAAHVLTECDNLGPRQTLRNLRSRLNQDPSRRCALAIFLAEFDQQTVIQHLDRNLLIGFGHGCEGTVTAVESIQLTTSDSHVLSADVVVPDEVSLGGVVVCHPHPAYGGNRFNNVVEVLFAALPAAGFAALRFDFRAGGGDGIAERIDTVAAMP